MAPGTASDNGRKISALASAIADVAVGRNISVVTAESVTAGNIAIALAASPQASEWFTGGIVAYQTSLKRTLLGVTAETIVSAECAEQMADGALRSTGADLAVSVTGVGGPGPEEGRPAGTVFICVGRRGDLTVFEHHLDGEPEAIVEGATVQALQHLRAAAVGSHHRSDAE